MHIFSTTKTSVVDMIYDQTRFLGVVAMGNVEHGGETAHLKHFILDPINFRRPS